MADSKREGMSEASQSKRDTKDEISRSPSGADSGDEHDRIRASNDQQTKRAGGTTPETRGEARTVKGQNGPTDPDSAESENDRDDTIDE